VTSVLRPPCCFIFFLVLLFLSDGQITAILDQKNYVEELNRHLRFVGRTLSFSLSPSLSPPPPTRVHQLLVDSSLCVSSASVNNLQAKVDALEKSNTKLTEEVRVDFLFIFIYLFIFFQRRCSDSRLFAARCGEQPDHHFTRRRGASEGGELVSAGVQEGEYHLHWPPPTPNLSSYCVIKVMGYMKDYKHIDIVTTRKCAT